MFRLNLGGGVVAFETEGEADRVISVNPSELSERQWPGEVVENVRKYQERLVRASTSSVPAETRSVTLATDGE